MSSAMFPSRKRSGRNSSKSGYISGSLWHVTSQYIPLEIITEKLGSPMHRPGEEMFEMNSGFNEEGD